jgi:predicted GIY-YIG superfamily endonuclease
MKHYVYKILNSNNEIEYIGETKNPKTRLRNHTSKNGKFHNRKDISIEIIKECRNKKSAFNYQCKLQKEFGFETDREKSSKNMKIVQKIATYQKSIVVDYYDINGNFVKTYPSIFSAKKELLPYIKENGYIISSFIKKYLKIRKKPKKTPLS